MKKEMTTIQDYIDEHTPLYTQNEVKRLLETLEDCLEYVTDVELKEEAGDLVYNKPWNKNKG